MTILIETNNPEWLTASQVRGILHPLLGDEAPIFTYPDDTGDLATVEMLVCTQLLPGLAAQLPNLKLVQKLGAGVETMAANPELPEGVRVCRLRSDACASEMAEFCLAFVLRDHKQIRHYATDQANHVWNPIEPPLNSNVTVGVLGLGFIGGLTAKLMATLGFRVLGWSRSPKSIEGVDSRHGPEALKPMLGECDYVCSVLPSTHSTRGLMNADMLASMKPGSTLINVGRGDLIDEEALLKALNAGQPAHVVLDVVSQEPLPADSPLWDHPGVTLIPHVSGWHMDGGFEDVADNWRSLKAGEALKNEIDRSAGY